MLPTFISHCAPASRWWWKEADGRSDRPLLPDSWSAKPQELGATSAAAHAEAVAAVEAVATYGRRALGWTGGWSRRGSRWQPWKWHCWSSYPYPSFLLSNIACLMIFSRTRGRHLMPTNGRFFLFVFTSSLIEYQPGYFFPQKTETSWFWRRAFIHSI